MIPAGLCLTSGTLTRRTLVRIAGAAGRPRRLTVRQVWRLYGFCEWAAFRLQDLAVTMEEEQ